MAGSDYFQLVEMVRKKSRKETLLPFAIIGLAGNEWFRISF